MILLMKKRKRKRSRNSAPQKCTGSSGCCQCGSGTCDFRRNFAKAESESAGSFFTDDGTTERADAESVLIKKIWLRRQKFRNCGDASGTCGYPLFFVSARQQEGIEPLRAALEGKTTTVAGPSGVGNNLRRSICWRRRYRWRPGR